MLGMLCLHAFPKPFTSHHHMVPSCTSNTVIYAVICPCVALLWPPVAFGVGAELCKLA